MATRFAPGTSGNLGGRPVRKPYADAYRKFADYPAKRRKHRHWRVTVSYRDGEQFVRVYTDRVKATGFAERQKKSPVVKETRITPVGT